ncbi:hypothetical protein L1D59_23710, partial [Pseudoalteromonas piscicida]|nr:hypothetical protein [Pseudoalteromonas piscicida]
MKLSNVFNLGFLTLSIISQGIQAFDEKIPDFSYNYKEYTNNSSEVATLSTDLFGDRIDYASGATSFSHSDLVLTLNGGLEFPITRTMRDPDSWHVETKELGNWSLKLPHIRSVYVEDLDGNHKNAAWATGAWCSTSISNKPQFSHTEVREKSTGVFDSTSYVYTKDHYWNGDSIQLLNGESYKILENTDTSGNITKVTKGNTKISCYSNAQTGKEGFKVVSNSGVTYYFDIQRTITDNATHRMATYPKMPCTRECPPPTVGDEPAPYPYQIMMLKRHVFLYPSKIEDKYGNAIEFSYVNNGLLKSISTSDKQSVEFTATDDGKYINTMTFNTREWVYTITQGTQQGSKNYDFLTEVQLPNSSRWLFSYPEEVNATRRLSQLPDGGPNCADGGASFIWIRMKHPKGAEGEFTGDDRCEAQTDVPKIRMHNPYSTNPNHPLQEYYIPKSVLIFSLINKKIT